MTNDKQLTEIERKVEALRVEIKERERRVNERIDEFLADRFSDKKKKETVVKVADKTAPQTGPQSIKEEKTQMSMRTMDRNLGAFYGSNELKEAIKDSMAKMHSTVGSLQKVREQTHTAFVRKEIEHLFKSVRILTQFFNRMMDKLELPDAGEDFFLDELPDRK